ncbi:MAG: hypothetical protein IJE50_05940 [Clostridia bacterium]|nr:hypothetical protein [Clostridia bacterium]
MAIGENKNKSPYHGVPLAAFLMIVVPVSVYILMRVLLSKYQPSEPAELNEASARTLGFGIGLAFDLSLMIAGTLKESFLVVVKRVVGFFQDLKFSFKIAWNCYVENIREFGVAFWILFGLIIVHFCLFWSGLSVVIQYFSN